MQNSLACLLLLSSTVLSQDPRVAEGYRKFRNQHVYDEMRKERCDQVINDRRITKTDSNECKETNTFIKATTNLINPICGQAGERVGDMTRSLLPFSIIVCELKNHGARRPHCQYRGKALTRRIKIRCEQGFPVHYEGGVVYLQN